MSAASFADRHLRALDNLAQVSRLDGKSDGLLLAARLVGEFAKTATPDDTDLLRDLLHEIVKRHTQLADEMRSLA